jgi:long-chain fatty acid transport protein
VFRDAFEVPYRIPVNAFLGGLPLVVDFSATALYTPQQLELGLAWSPSSDWTIAGEVLWNRWSQFPDPALRIDLELTIPVLPIVFTDSLVRDPGFRDTVSGRLGVEVRVATWSVADLALRGGYSFEPSPAPEQTGDTNLLDNDRHILSAGIGSSFNELFGRALPHPLRVDGYTQAQLFSGRLHVKTDAVGADHAGSPSIRSDGVIYHLGLMISTELEMLDR